MHALRHLRRREPARRHGHYTAALHGLVRVLGQGEGVGAAAQAVCADDRPRAELQCVYDNADAWQTRYNGSDAVLYTAGVDCDSRNMECMCAVAMSTRGTWSDVQRANCELFKYRVGSTCVRPTFSAQLRRPQGLGDGGLRE